MQHHYIGTKLVRVIPMTRRDYNEYRGWTVPEDECPTDPGYMLENLDGNHPNHPGHAGHISWYPKELFENEFLPAFGMTFGLAIEALKLGKRVARAGWNGKGMWLKLVPADLKEWVASEDPEALKPLDWIGMKTADKCFVPWLASQTDMLATDWQLVD